MTRRLLLGYLTVTVTVLLLLEIPLAVFYAQREREGLKGDAERDASVIATIYEDVLESGTAADPGAAEEYAARTGARVVVVDTDGISVVDTELPPPRDFSTRPEIETALTGRRATGTRPSDTLDADLLYVALPVASGGVVHGAVRLTLETDEVDRHIQRFWVALLGAGLVVIATMALVGWAIARSVTRPLRLLTAAAHRFATGDLAAGPGDVVGPPELQALGDSMSVMAARLDALLDQQRAFVADASHQLRTPLTALRLRLENLQSRLRPSDSAELDVAIDEIARLSALVADLLQLARAGRDAETVDVDLVEAASERVDTWTAVAEAHQVRLRLDAPRHPVRVAAVQGTVEQVLDNALDNAMQVAPAGTSITVRVVADDSVPRLIVEDEGPGLTDDDKRRAVQRFWRGDTSTPGSGLGLAIATELARRSHGSLDLADADGGGLRVVLSLPAASAHDHSAASTCGR